MGTLLVTVAHGGRRRDLAVRSDVPIADILGPLAQALADDPPPARRLRAPHQGPAPSPVEPSGAKVPGPVTAAVAPDPAEGPGETVRQGLALAPLCGQPLPVERSLEACGVGHGAMLVLIDGSCGAPSPDSRRPGAPSPGAGRRSS